jgi:hypothetical protein
MRAAECIRYLQGVLERRGEPTYRLEQAYFALILGWEEATDLPRGLRAVLAGEAPAARDLRDRPAALSH